jgi:Family of unknown function (DUF5677)
VGDSEQIPEQHSYITMSAARFQRMLSQESDGIADDILALSKKQVKQQETYQRLRHNIKEHYSEAWDCFDAIIFSMQQNGLLMLKRMDEVGEDEHSDVRTALSLIHSSATVTLYEIRTLLLEGLWAGAAGRWRPLHELAVTAVLVARGESAIARRYLDHGFVTQTERLNRFYNRHARGPVSPQELSRRQAKSVTLIDRCTLPDQRGSFADPYGWAAPFMSVDRRGKRRSPSFPELEMLADLDDYRELVFMAHGMAHTDSGGVVTSSLFGPGQYVIGPIDAFTSTVARPALISASRCIAATHLGFENRINEFAQSLGLLASGAMKLASRALELFPLEEQ